MITFFANKHRCTKAVAKIVEIVSVAFRALVHSEDSLVEDSLVEDNLVEDSRALDMSIVDNW